MNEMHRHVIAIPLSTLILAGALCSSSDAQIVTHEDLDMRGEIRNGSIQLSIVPEVSDTMNAFDGVPSTSMAGRLSDTVSVTLQFQFPQPLTGSSLVLPRNGSWTIEGADAIWDLNAKTGSFVRLAAGRNEPGSTRPAEAAFPRVFVGCVRLTVHGIGTPLLIAEWVLHKSYRLTGLMVLPGDPQLLPGTTLQLKAGALDENTRLVPFSGPVAWKVSDPSIASADEAGRLTGIRKGRTEIEVKSPSLGLSGRSSASVVATISPRRAPPLHVRVALVLVDPFIAPGKRVHDKYHWRDPLVMAGRLVYHFLTSSDSVVDFRIVDTIYTDRTFSTFPGDSLMPVSRWMELYDNKAITRPPYAQFDYRAFVRYFGFDRMRNNGEIDEVWVYSPPFTGMYESQLLGPTAFWWNSPPITDGTSLKKLLSVMGLNYERGVDMAFHSFGHRLESAVMHAYGDNWNDTSSSPTAWDLFTRIDKDAPRDAHCGNVHFPPNGRHDYDYDDSVTVTSSAQNWYRYPYILNETSPVDRRTWYYAGEPMAESRYGMGYLRWWYDHIPRYNGASEGVLNNWWYYALDFDAAVLAARAQAGGTR